MYKTLRKKRLTGMIVTLVIFTLLGVWVFIANKETRDYILTGDNINTMDAYEVREGNIVHGRIRAMIGAYGSDDEGSYYIIPVGEDKYMGIFLKDKYEDRAIQIINDTYDYLDGKRDKLSSTSISTRGIIYEMSESEKVYFYEWFTEGGEYTLDEIKQYTLPYTYEVISFKDWNTERDIWVYIFIGVSLFIVVYVLIYMLTKRDLAPVKRTIAERGWQEERVEADVIAGMQLKDALIGRQYILVCGIWKWQLYSLHDIVWAYQLTHTTEHRLYGIIKTGTTVTYAVHYVLRNGKRGGIHVRSEPEAQNILQYLKTTKPHMILGYSDQLNLLAQNTPSELVRLSNELEMKAQNTQNQGYYEGTSQAEDTWNDDTPSLKFPQK